jgi:hypothetical protein
MRYQLSRHAREEMANRMIAEDVMQAVASAPEQIAAGHGGRLVHQSRVEWDNGRTYLVRVVVAPDTVPPTVVTIYRTTKVERYWRAT